MKIIKFYIIFIICLPLIAEAERLGNLEKCDLYFENTIDDYDENNKIIQRSVYGVATHLDRDSLLPDGFAVTVNETRKKELQKYKLQIITRNQAVKLSPSVLKEARHGLKPATYKKDTKQLVFKVSSKIKKKISINKDIVFVDVYLVKKTNLCKSRLRVVEREEGHL